MSFEAKIEILSPSFLFLHCPWQYQHQQSKALKREVGPKAPSDLQLPLRQWGASNVYLLVLSIAKR